MMKKWGFVLVLARESGLVFEEWDQAQGFQPRSLGV